jgi:coenzyme F420-0:L-glutamate ligase/coenzyme F420-1:gamma-L-glutamate ligase
MTLQLTPLERIPLIKPGDDLVRIILDSLRLTGIEIERGDILVLAQKIVSKAEDRLVNLTTVEPSSRALELEKVTGKDPRLLELVLQESEEVLRVRPGLIIVEHRLGFICANAGIDHSNVRGSWGDHDDWVLLLPIAPDKSAKMIRKQIEVVTGKKIGLMIIDSHGRAWRMGSVGVCIGLSGLPGVEDLRGKKDLFNYKMQYTEVGIADELAGAASLTMGQINESTPVIHVRGFPYLLRESSMKEIIRPKEKDLFR